MTQIPTAKRLTCSQCLRPQRTCICHWIVPVENAPEIVNLQHPLEAGNAKNSARLLHLSLARSQLLIGEVFAEHDLHALIHAPCHPRSSEGMQAEQTAKHTLLLYPETPEDKSTGILQAPAFDTALLRDPAQLRLIMLDGTWRKTRKMLYLNPLLQTLPRLPLQNLPLSRYRIRKAHKPDQLSTLEAGCQALMQLEHDQEKYATLLNAFDGFVDEQLAYTTVSKSRRASALEGDTPPDVDNTR